MVISNARRIKARLQRQNSPARSKNHRRSPPCRANEIGDFGQVRFLCAATGINTKKQKHLVGHWFALRQYRQDEMDFLARRRATIFKSGLASRRSREHAHRPPPARAA